MKYYFYLIGLFFSLSWTACQSDEAELEITAYVNPFIGTSGQGHCFPGAVYPFGGIQLSPDNPRDGADWCSGYQYTDSVISSFSHTHLSGTRKGDFQDIRFLPVVTIPDTSQSPLAYIQSGYARFSHTNEQAEPGYYSVAFDNGIKTELSVTQRCGIHYYQYPANTPHALTIDLSTGRNDDHTTEASVRKVNNRTLEGFRKSSGWAKDQRVYFVIEFSQDCHVLAGDQKFIPLLNRQKYSGRNCYIRVDFGENTDKILAKISISPANTEGAIANLEKELSHWSFDKVRKDAKLAWKRELQKISVESRAEEQLKIFYSALYHTYTAPSLFSDVNGNYKGPDGEIHSVSKHTQYTILSPGDTYRAIHPLFTLTQKKRVSDIVNSMLKHYDAHGQLPMCELAGNETDHSVGNHSAAVIAEAWLKGIRNFDGEKAYDAIKKTVPRHLPDDPASTSVAQTLEYAYDDWCIAQMAKALGKEDDYLHFLKSSKNYTNLFDPSTGFIQDKSATGEENTWQYSWMVQQDIEDLIALQGGAETFATKLDGLFEGEATSPDTSGFIGQYTHDHGSAHHIAYLYNYAGQPHKTQFYVNRILTELYKNTPGGLCGNDAYGQLSAWYVFSAMGFYPVNPVEAKYQLGAPLFDKITIRTGPEKKFIITANKENDQYIYVKEVFLNNKKLDRTWITHEEIMNGGTLEFVLTPSPDHL